MTAWQTHDRFLRLCETEPEKTRDALAQLWAESDEPEESRLRSFLDQLDPSAAKGAGIRTTLLSFLLMALNVERHPMYRAKAFKKASKLAGYQRLTPGADEIQQYRFAIGFLDELIKASHDWDQPITNRLEAQGVVWGIVKWAGKPDDWSDEEWEGLQGFRTGKAVSPVDIDETEDGDEIGDDEPEQSLDALAEKSVSRRRIS